tara:strand:+ start:762 stop:989 length:228 start_codon:yes stop_codon:yes gene_type:complete
MDLSFFINKTIQEIRMEINKEKNMKIIKEDILNPCIEHVIKELYPYFVKGFIIIIILFIFLICIFMLNLKIIYKN